MITVPVARFTWRYTNFNTPSTSPGTLITPGSNAKGSWYALASAANIQVEVWGFMLWVCAGNTASKQRDMLIDIGIDPAGGSSYTSIISNLVCGQSAGPSAGGRYYYFPLRIPAGASVAARGQANNTSTVRVCVTFYGRPTDPTAIFQGQFAETIGAITGNGGVSFTPGASGAEGSWTLLGTTPRRLRWWQIGVQVSNATTTSRAYYHDLAYGDGTNMQMIIQNYPVFLPGTAEIVASPLLMEGVADVPLGASVYIRSSCSGTPASGWNAVAIGVG